MRDHRRPSFRYYLPVGELKTDGMDRTGVLAVEAENQRAHLAAEILASFSYRCTMDRCLFQLSPQVRH